MSHPEQAEGVVQSAAEASVGAAALTPVRGRRASAAALLLITAWVGFLAYQADVAPSTAWIAYFSVVSLGAAMLGVLVGVIVLRRRASAAEGAAEGAPVGALVGAPESHVHGRKVARLVKSEGELALVPVSGRATYGAEADAECVSPVRTTRIRFPIEQSDLIDKAMSLHDGRHEPPGAHCVCGFHATRDAHPMLLPGQVVLDVELSRKRIRTGTGYRAAHQKVVSVHVPRMCSIEDASEGAYKSSCGRFAVGVLVLQNGLWPMCERHGMDMNVSLEEVADQLGVAVQWLDWGALGPVEDHPELSAGVAEFLRDAADRVGFWVKGQVK